MRDGGHMVVPSIGQAMPSSTSSTASAATGKSGNVHIVPITWHKVNKNTSAKYCVLCLSGWLRSVQHLVGRGSWEPRRHTSHGGVRSQPDRHKLRYKFEWGECVADFRTFLMDNSDIACLELMAS